MTRNGIVKYKKLLIFCRPSAYHLIHLLSKVSFCFFLALLSSCSHHLSKADGPPDFYIDENKIPNAIPKPEPLAKYGNMNSYHVLGKRYYTLKSSKHYEAVGIASWYGTKFHRRSTSSGEAYNMLGMTAAHKTLPLPTYVEVTNLRNHRKIIVKVNDRGPFESNRLIDLSYVAAKKLSMLGHGTALVKIKAIDPYIFAANKIKTSPSQRWSGQQKEAPSTLNRGVTSHLHPIVALVYLQVGAFQNKFHAKRLQQHLTHLLATPVKITHPSVKTKLYRVQVGPFKNNLAADKMDQQLKQLGIKSNKFYGA